MFQPRQVSHLESVFGRMEHEPLMRMGADGLRLVNHGHVYVAGADEGASTRRAESLYHQPVYRIRLAPARAEPGEGDPQIPIPFDFLTCRGQDRTSVVTGKQVNVQEKHGDSIYKKN